MQLTQRLKEIGILNIYNQLIEKYQEIQSLLGKLKNIVQSLRDKIGNLSIEVEFEPRN